MTTILRAFTPEQLAAVFAALDRPRMMPSAALAELPGATQAARTPVNGEALCMPVVCSGWEDRARHLELPKKGEKRERDREAYMQGAMAALVAAGLMTQERGSQIAFLCAVGRLPDYMAKEAAKLGEVQS